MPAGRRREREREPAVAGSFYPGRAAALASLVDGLLEAAFPPRMTAPRALVAPHAGYRYSGAVAAHAYALLRGDTRDRVVVLGPSHFAPLEGFAVPAADTWRTPLGTVAVDTAGRAAALECPRVDADDGPHRHEHALEVQLPFLQRTLAPGVRVLPVAVQAPPEPVADLLDAVVTPGTLVVVSTDLSHYLPEPVARERDERTVSAVLQRRPDLVGDRDACGAAALRGLLAWALRRDLAPHRLRTATSAEATRDVGRVVGYGAFAFA